MSRPALALLLAALALPPLAAGCGGDDPPDLEPEATVRQWLDADDCAVVTDDYAGSNYGSREECEDDPFEGAREGTYTVLGARASGDEATVRVEFDDREVNRYDLVRDEEDRWRIDDWERVRDAPVVAFGEPQRWNAALYLGEGNERPVDVRVTMTPETYELIPQPAIFTQRLKVRLRNESRATVPLDLDHDLALTRGNLDLVGNYVTAESASTHQLGPGEEVVAEVTFDGIPTVRMGQLRWTPNGAGSPLRWTLPGGRG